ncbi:hypothetical protein Syun_027672 [Stephania yunnanensis]|uniref:Uncharacterized protein n=1 Tax=Stephania yunnanensis TaxID=152371 RepID=A0AAP0HQF5_9MAGN
MDDAMRAWAGWRWRTDTAMRAIGRRMAWKRAAHSSSAQPSTSRPGKEKIGDYP